MNKRFDLEAVRARYLRSKYAAAYEGPDAPDAEILETDLPDALDEIEKVRKQAQTAWRVENATAAERDAARAEVERLEKELNGWKLVAQANQNAVTIAERWRVRARKWSVAWKKAAKGHRQREFRNFCWYQEASGFGCEAADERDQLKTALEELRVAALKVCDSYDHCYAGGYRALAVSVFTDRLRNLVDQDNNNK